MGSKTRLGSYCTKRANNGVNLVTSRNINTRLAHPMFKIEKILYVMENLIRQYELLEIKAEFVDEL